MHMGIYFLKIFSLIKSALATLQVLKIEVHSDNVDIIAQVD